MAFQMPKAREALNAVQASFAAQEVLTLFEAAALLKVSEKTLWSQAKAGAVPHFKIGKQYRFVRSELLNWASGAPVVAQ